VSPRKRPLSREEIARTFTGRTAEQYPPILSPQQLAGLLRLSVKSIHHWIAQGHFDGAFRKRGKHVLIWRARALDLLLKGKDWHDD
jgi:hypothetical protein